MKWRYIELISEMSNKYGDKLLELMSYFDKYNLCDISVDEAKEFYEILTKNKR